MLKYTDDDVQRFLDQQEANFKRTSKGSGYNAQEARSQLKKIGDQTKEERLRIGREQLEFMDTLQMQNTG